MPLPVHPAEPPLPRPESEPVRQVEAEAEFPEAILAGRIGALLRVLGEDPKRDGLQKTPERVARGYGFLTSGYGTDPHVLLRTGLVGAMSREMVLVRNVDVYALCERYLMPFFGRVHVAYLPEGSTVEPGVVARMIDVLARRLQTQERLTRQIHDALAQVLAPCGVAVALEARHTALLMCGSEKQHAVLTTHATSGAFRQPEHRAAFDRLIHESGAPGRYMPETRWR